MGQIRSYPQATSLLSSDAFVIDRAGSGTRYIEASDLDITSAQQIVATIAALSTATPANGGLAFVLGYLSNGDGGEGQFWYDASDTTTADNGGTVIVATRGVRWKRWLYAGITTPRMFGAVHNGGSSDVTAVNNWLTYVAANGGTHVWQAGNYLHAGQAVLNVTTARNLAILGSGATITTTGANSGLQIIGKETPFTQLVVGVAVNHSGGDGQAVAGFEQANTANVTFLATTVLADNTVPGTYAARLMRQSDITNGDTACFWTTFIGNADRSTGGVTVPTGVLMVGQQNATTFVGHSIEGVTDQVKMIAPAGGAPNYGLPSGVSFLGSWFEAGVNAIRIIGASGLATAHGITSFGSRYESLSGYVLSLEGATVDSNQPPYFGPGAVISNVSGLVHNLNGLIVNSDFLWLDAGPGAAFTDSKHNNFGFALRSEDNSNDVLTVISPNTGSGIGIKNATPTLIGSWRPQSGIEMAHKAENGYVSVDSLGSAYTVSALPSASTHTRGRTWVTDATATTFNSIVAGTGSNMVPVFSDGTSWRIG